MFPDTAPRGKRSPFTRSHKNTFVMKSGGRMLMIALQRKNMANLCASSKHLHHLNVGNLVAKLAARVLLHACYSPIKGCN